MPKASPGGSARARRRRGWLVRVCLLIVCLQAVYACVFISRSSFTVAGERYFCLFDDAMISMRYAANWANGDGLVWNPGERVEGYTNFGWTMLMGIVHLLPLSPARLCLAMQIIGALVWIGCVPATAALAGACRLPRAAIVVAVVLVVWQWNLIFFSLNGMETGLLTLLVTMGLTGVVRSLRARQGSVAPFVWLALTMLMRPDALIVVIVAAVAMICMAGRRAHTLVGLGIVASVVAGHMLWRHDYYGSWLPNTYYLKATGWPQGLRLRAGMKNGLWTAGLLAVPFAIGLIALVRNRSWVVLLLVLVGAMFGYSIYIGGDAWPMHYRFLLPATPGLFVCAAIAVDRAARTAHSARTRTRLRAAAVVVLPLTVNWAYLPYWTLAVPPPGTAANESSVRYARAALEIADPDATAAVEWAGAFPYFSKLRCCDLLGKCDPHIAHLPAHDQPNRAGHNKYDVPWTLRTYQPDIVVDRHRELPERFYFDYEPALVTIDGRKVVLAVRKGSSAIREADIVDWDLAREVFLSTPRY